MISTEQMIRFAESGNQQRVSLTDGRVLQGWIMEIDEDCVVISIGAGEHGQDVTVMLSEIRPEALQYWDARQQVWVAFNPAAG